MSLSLPTVRDPFHQMFTKHMRTFRACILRYNNIQTFGLRLLRNIDSPTSVRACLQKIINVCHTTPAIVMKFIRLEMEKVVKYLPYFPNLKVIHLVRDPRGMFNSRVKIGLISRKHGENQGQLDRAEIRKFCNLLHKDLSVTKYIQSIAPEKIKLVQYEDLAQNPMRVATELLSFVNERMTPKMENFLKHMTSSTRDSCPFCTQRKNSAKTARKWRSELKLKDALYIYDLCSESMDVLGYLPLRTSFDMKNLMTPSWSQPNVTFELSNSDHFWKICSLHLLK